MPYTTLKEPDREAIHSGLAQGHSPSRIAKDLNRPRSTITREISRNLSPQGYYSAFSAQKRADHMASSRHCVRKIDKNPLLNEIVENGLSLYWSPEQIAHTITRMFPDEPLMHISHESIYTYLYVQGKGTLKKELTRYLRYQRTIRKPRSGRAEKRGKIPDMISIHERPPEVEDRTVPGHWEGDLIMGAHNRSAIGTIAERTSRYLLLVKLEAHDAATVREEFAKVMTDLPAHLRRTMTYDQGKEMSEHRLFTEETKILVFFADPHSPWQRGTNENTNGLVRQFYPKGADFSNVTPEHLHWVQDLMNTRPRETLDWRSPSEVFFEFYNECDTQPVLHPRKNVS
jgi:IS30 family transposase